MRTLGPRFAAFMAGCIGFVVGGVGLSACQQDPDLPPIATDDAADSGTAKPDATKDADASKPKDSGEAGPPLDLGVDTGPIKPPPVEDTFGVEDYGVPVPGAHVEGTIGPLGGTLEGTIGPLAGVKLVVPPGALAIDTLLALDALATPGGPPGGTVVSPFVRVGPETTFFSVPARLTLPWKSASTNPQLAVVARSGFTFSALVEPTADATSITVSLGRGVSAEAVTFELSTTTPKFTAASPSTAAPGAVVFIDGSGFGFAPVVRPLADGGVTGSSVTIGGQPAVATGWSDLSLSVRMPAGDGGVVSVTTPGGSASGGSVVAP